MGPTRAQIKYSIQAKSQYALPYIVKTTVKMCISYDLQPVDTLLPWKVPEEIGRQSVFGVLLEYPTTQVLNGDI